MLSDVLSFSISAVYFKILQFMSFGLQSKILQVVPNMALHATHIYFKMSQRLIISRISTVD